MKLGLGTVQFGQAYGVSNKHGQVRQDEARAILVRAAQAGVRVLDTAANYGEAEAVLAQQDTAPFRIVTKTMSATNGVEAVIARVRALHSYTVPCVVSLAVEGGNPDFLDWIARETAPQG